MPKGAQELSFYFTSISLIITFVIIAIVVENVQSQKDWKQKDIRDYNEADMERLYEQWEKDEEPLDDDELPEYLRKSPPIDMSKMDFSNPENVLRTSKKGKTLMTFVSVGGNPTRQETETITALWQSSLQNSHIIADRFIVSDDRAIFMFKDGSQAWDAKDFLITQDRCKDVTIDNKVYPGINYQAEHQEL
ncbi:LDLR chaperone boca [Sarcoptes scabiei]|uniref:LDLR chaperone boca n=1 Tax=Sarcoptes scabiei TaxID=52283 RepID=A0A834R5G7_SARSC|nr:LDLR chaperone boca [Sarcoptes scabiei]